MMQHNNDVKAEQIDLLDFLLALVNRRWMIVKTTFLAAVLALLLTFLIPKKYTATAILMPPAEGEKNSMLGVFSQVSVPGLSLPSNTTSAEILVQILKSRAVGERVLNRFFHVENDTLPLYRILKAPSSDIACWGLPNIVAFTVSEQGFIAIAAKMHNPQIAADVANAFVTELDNVNQEKSVSRAKSSRIYIAEQLVETEKKLTEATERLALFQQQNKTIALEEQTKASIEQAGELKGQILAQEIQLGVMLKSMKSENPLVVQTRRQLEALNRRYQELQHGGSPTSKNDDVFLPITDVPHVGVQLALLLREAKAQETVWQLLNQQYYQAKIEEARNTPTVQVLDVAVPPPFPSSPKRKMWVFVFALLGFFLGIVAVFFQAYVKQLESRPQEKARWLQMMGNLRDDVHAVKSRFLHQSQHHRN